MYVGCSGKVAVFLQIFLQFFCGVKCENHKPIVAFLVAPGFERFKKMSFVSVLKSWQSGGLCPPKIKHTIALYAAA